MEEHTSARHASLVSMGVKEYRFRSNENQQDCTVCTDNYGISGQNITSCFSPFVVGMDSGRISVRGKGPALINQHLSTLFNISFGFST